MTRSYRRKVVALRYLTIAVRNMTLFFFGAAAWAADDGLSWWAILGFFLFGQAATVAAEVWEFRYRMICRIPDPWLDFRHLLLGDQETREP